MLNQEIFLGFLCLSHFLGSRALLEVQVWGRVKKAVKTPALSYPMADICTTVRKHDTDMVTTAAAAVACLDYWKSHKTMVISKYWAWCVYGLLAAFCVSIYFLFIHI